MDRSLKPNPPCDFGLHITCHFSQYIFRLSSHCPPKKNLQISASISWHKVTSILKQDIVYVWISASIYKLLFWVESSTINKSFHTTYFQLLWWTWFSLPIPEKSIETHIIVEHHPLHFTWIRGVLYTIRILSSGSNSIHSITSFTILK